MTNSTNSSSEVLTEQELRTSLTVIEIKKGIRFSRQVLAQLLDTPEDVLFFGQVYDLSPDQLGRLMVMLFDTDLVTALFGESAVHSTELQDYLVEIANALAEHGELTFDDEIPAGEFLPEVWKSLEIEVAQSIKDVATKLASVIGLLPGKKGKMVFQSMRTMNAKRGTIGNYQAAITHPMRADNLVILDVSGSMTHSTVRAIIDDVVALSYMAEASLAIVSDTCTFWNPGEFNSDVVLERAEFWGTHYEQLEPLLNRDWGVVVTIADYDSSLDAKRHLANNCSGSIQTVLDLSLVNQPTFLAECVGQFANEVKPLIIAPSQAMLGSN